MPIFLSALIVALPTYLYARLVRGIDRFEQEPAKYLFIAFVWGALPAAFLALIFQTMLTLPITFIWDEAMSAAVNSIVFAPLTEELLKGLMVALIYLQRRREFDGWVDGIVYGSTVGFGFAYAENIVYLASADSPEEWVRLFILRVIVFGFMHGFYTSLIGIGFGVARHAASPARAFWSIALGWAAAVVTHAIHNASVTLADASEGQSLGVTLLNYGLLIALMLGLRWVSKRHDREMFRAYLADEPPDVVPPRAYDALIGVRSSAGSRGAQQLDKSFYHLAGELAQRKRQLVQYGEPVTEEIDRLRDQLRALNASRGRLAAASPSG
ncbi:MAG: PrsW family intramembrane metalloprotease [Thermoflexales bacterium]